jgi:hypothetical protein
MTATTGAGSRRRGKGWELACRKALTSLGIPCRAPQAGESGDDIVLLPPTARDTINFTYPPEMWSIEAKDKDSIPTGALGAAVDQAQRQAGPNRVGVVWVKRRGKPDALDGFIVINARDFWGRVA